MEIEELVSLIAKQVKERLDAFEKRKKVLMLGSFQGTCLENLCSMLESNGFSLCGEEMYQREQNIDDYEFIVVTKSKFREMFGRKEQNSGNRELENISCIEGKGGTEVSNNLRLDKRVLTESDIQAAVRSGCREIVVCKKTVITPLAFDSAKVCSIRIIRE